MTKEISAKFMSRCSACGSTINPGDKIIYDPAVKYSSRHKVCPGRVKQDPKPKIAKGTLLNGPVIAQPQVARLSDEEAAKILTEAGSQFVRELPTAAEPTLGIGYKITIDGVEREIGTCNNWVGQVADYQKKESWVVSLVDGAVLEHRTQKEANDLSWMHAPLDRYAREMGAPLSREASGKNSVRVGELLQHQGHWYVVTATEKPYYLSAADAEDFDMFDRGGGWGTPYQMREITEPAKAKEAREAKERADREQAEAAIAAHAAARAKAAEVLPLGTRPATSTEYADVMKAIRDNTAELIAEYSPAEKPSDGARKLIAAAKLERVGWTRLYRVGNRIALWGYDGSYDGIGAYLNGIQVLPEDTALIEDQKHRASIRGYRFQPELYAAMVAADAAGTLDKYGRGSYFGGSPSPCYHLPEAERANTKAAYSAERNHTASEIRADLTERFQKLGNAAVLAILQAEDSVVEIC